MKNVDMLLKGNETSCKKVKLSKGVARIEIKGGLFSGTTLKYIAEIVNAVHKQYRGIKVPIEFYFGNVNFIDKLTFVIFECICYDLIYNYGHYVQVYMTVDVKNDIYVAGIMSSPLLLLSGTNKSSVKKYLGKFRMDLYRTHFRRLIKGEEKENTNYLGEIYREIDIFLKTFNIEEDSRDKIANVVSELVGNACEHGRSDCLMDIDVAPNYEKIVEDIPDGHNYYGINIVVVNLSEVLLGQGIRDNMLNKEYIIGDDRYNTVLKAYNNHMNFFSQDYTIEDFCNITTFQHKISGREEKMLTGGTGLTKLILSLAERSDAYRCYVVSGNRAINFYKELLEYDNERWIGFNKEKDYVSNIPGKNNNGEEVVSETLMFMPGTGYNLNFVMEVGGKNSGE